MAQQKTAKNECPKCRQRFRAGPLPTANEQRRLAKEGIVDVGEPESVDCPKCRTKLRVVSVRMGTFFTLE